ncbi:MAG: hypothetical protein WA962_11680, partial [Ornithinimicrobium sp.]
MSRLRIRLRLAETWITFEDDGLHVVSRALDRLRDECLSAGHADLEALCDIQQAAVSGRGGDLSGALNSMRRAEAGRSLLTDEEQARLLINRGSLLILLGDPKEASRDLAEAAVLAVDADMAAVRFKAMHNQGYAEFLLGNLPVALTLMERADRMEVDVDRGIARLDRARVMLEAGLVDEAHELLLRVLTHTEHEGSQHDLGEIELDLARSEMLLGDSASARERALTARHRFQRRGESGWRRTALLSELEAGGQGAMAPAARERLARVLGEVAAREGDETVRQGSMLVRAEALIDQGRPVDARDALAQAPGLLRSAHLATRLHARHVSARISLGSDQRQSAARTLKRAAEDLGAAGRQSAGLDLRTALTAHGSALASLDLDIAMRFGTARQVLARTELWRDVVRTLPPMRTSDDPDRASAIRRLRRAREDLRLAPPEAPQAPLRAEVSRAERAARELDWTTEVDAKQVSPTHGPLSPGKIVAAVQQAGVAMLTTFIRG